MNDKQAKKFRKFARAAAADMPALAYRQHIKRGYIFVDPQTVRGIYLMFKKAAP